MGKAKAAATWERGKLAGLVVHEDLDAVTDRTYDTVRATLAEALARHSPCGTALALAAWETEAWLLLFPDAFPSVHRSWKVPATLARRDTGRLNNPKEILQQKLGAPRYRESEASKIAEEARRQGLLSVEPQGSNRSFSDFCTELARLT